MNDIVDRLQYGKIIRTHKWFRQRFGRQTQNLPVDFPDGDFMSALDALLGPPPQVPGTSSPPTGIPSPPVAPAQQQSAAEYNCLLARVDGRTDLDYAIRRYCMFPGAVAFDELHVAIDTAFSKVEEFAIGQTKIAEREFLMWLVSEIDKDFVTHHMPPSPPHFSLMPIAKTLWTISNFACLDEPANRHLTRLPSIPKNRVHTFDDEPPPTDARIPYKNEYNEDEVLRHYHGLMRYRAAECLGFAMLAAGVLLSTPIGGTIRIENDGLHKWVRYSPTPNPGHDICIDLWMGSVGKPYFYTAFQYPFRAVQTNFAVTRANHYARL